jgi:quinohemoprotein ethanol dehydrogenase
VVAINPDTGKYIWHYQENPQEAWDYNATQPFILADLTIDGRKRKALMHAPKNGFFYVLDRITGKVISAKNYVPVTWTTGIDLATGRPNEVPNSRYTNAPFVLRPNTSGSHNWHQMSFDQKAGVVYLHAFENGVTVSDDPDFKPIFRGPFNTGNKSSPDPTPLSRPELGAMTLLAWDPVNQKEVWRVPNERAGVLATAGGLVFIGQGQTTGALNAYRADNGEKVWSYPTPNGIQAGAVSYAVNGVQYIAVTTGNGWSPAQGDAAARARQNGRMVVFKLNGTARLPAPPGPPPPANPSEESFTAAQAQKGSGSYVVFCSRCHGGNAASLNVIPDLRRSGALPSRATWNAVVLGGALAHNGMISWKDHLSADQVEDIRAYVNGEAVKLKAREQGKAVTASKGPAAEAQ